MTTPALRVRAQAAFETRTLLGNGEQLLVSLILPAMALVGLAVSATPDLGPGRRIDIVVPSVLALAVVSTAFTGQAIATGFDRRYGVLRLLGVTPLGRSGLLAGKALAVLVVVALQTIVLSVIGVCFSWQPHLGGLLVGALLMLLGTWTWVAVALLLAGTLRAEAVLAVANLLWVIFAAVGGLLYPTAKMPAGVGDVVRLLPSGALGDGLRDALTGHDGSLLRPVLVLLVWGLAATALSAKLFRWDDK
ncbi:ABC transporter permease [Flexivirga sp. ID2601S]|uniref:ABC transporter permease n=1 Tax=Flexivirga aerilata TaxID=1656889 RepID=A0A849AWQ4_9MICO|nr:ABC transporter permease [Flexivirga aerilata]NNG41102.1 ABC transporter permease [Flexivirga aerilata]